MVPASLGQRPAKVQIWPSRLVIIHFRGAAVTSLKQGKFLRAVKLVDALRDLLCPRQDPAEGGDRDCFVVVRGVLLLSAPSDSATGHQPAHPDAAAAGIVLGCKRSRIAQRTLRGVSSLLQLRKLLFLAWKGRGTWSSSSALNKEMLIPELASRHWRGSTILPPPAAQGLPGTSPCKPWPWLCHAVTGIHRRVNGFRGERG